MRRLAGASNPAAVAAPPVPEFGRAAALREQVEIWRAGGETVALVPTLGNLHAGHMSLASLARKAADRVVMSIFVNPTQFGDNEDFEGYPRTLAEDRATLAKAGGVDLLFVPDETEIYPFGTRQAVRFLLPDLSRDLCGANRPGHFDGVASVVGRLLNIAAPNSLVLGRKDYQQLVLLKHLVADLHLPVRIVSGATRREADGLALSSRNRYLSADERRRAPSLHSALEHIAIELRHGTIDYRRLERAAGDTLAEAGFKPDYVQVRRAADLLLPTGGEHEPLIVLGAAWLGRARLIDNVEV